MSDPKTFIWTDRKSGETKSYLAHSKEGALEALASYLGWDCDEHRKYGVSFGNGNDGVSQLFPRYVVETHDPYLLARLAMIHEMEENTQDWAAEEVEVEGEAEYTVSATIMNPPDDDPQVDNTYECGCGYEWTSTGSVGEVGECPQCGEEVEPDEVGDVPSWSDNNGAWQIVEVFPIEDDDIRDGVHVYKSLTDCFGEEFTEKYDG